MNDDVKKSLKDIEEYNIGKKAKITSIMKIINYYKMIKLDSIHPANIYDTNYEPLKIEHNLVHPASYQIMNDIEFEILSQYVKYIITKTKYMKL